MQKKNGDRCLPNHSQRLLSASSGFQSNVSLLHLTCDGGTKPRRCFRFSTLSTDKTNLREYGGVVFKLTLCLY